MKKIFTIIFCNALVILSAQDLKFDQVIKIDSTTTKMELFNRARSWAKENYNSKNNYIITEDPNYGEISGTGIMDYRTNNKYRGYSCVEGSIKYSFSIYVKDGKYKYLFNAFDHKGSAGNLCRAGNFGRVSQNSEAPSIGKGIAYEAALQDVREKIATKIKALITSIELGMSKKYEGSNDW
ncbi:DUF4468 domain-containing protein [Chryseobacterium sp. WLY505]|uniref:DUF4468 domain-containing protein n=1 Tax=Chryseobacterium sp. WLY505 TaxID=3068892 RepID=UPI002796C27E|nr:DUF4468 domain-containing protein [Chryseobacterium sp. WLY505]MDQ1859257.1 DUF4468 domain-containing protein [Chryseobacterium sp. WLY505]